MNPFKCEYIQLQIPSNLNTFGSEFLLMKFKSESIWFWKEHFEGLQMWIHSDTNPFKQNSNLKVLVSEGIILKVFKCEYIQIQIPFRVNTFKLNSSLNEFLRRSSFRRSFIRSGTFWQPLIQSHSNRWYSVCTPDYFKRSLVCLWRFSQSSKFQNQRNSAARCLKIT